MSDVNTNALADLGSIATVMRGAPMAPGRGLLTLCMDDLLAQRIEHAIVVRIVDGQGTMLAKLKWEARGIFALQDGSALCVGARGRSAHVSATLGMETLAGDLDQPGIVGLIRDAVQSPEGVLAVSLDGRLFARPLQGGWQCVMDITPDCVIHRLGQGAVAPGSLLAASADGRAFRQQGRHWSLIDLPTSGIVNGIWQMSPTRFVACGLQGLLLSADGDAIRVIEHDFMHENFWGICVFEDKVYVASLHHLYVWDAREGLSRIDPLDATSFHGLSVAAGVLWSIGGKDVLELSQGQWRRII